MKLIKKPSLSALISVLSFSVLSFIVTGCSTFKNNVADNSLDYQNAKLLIPVELPENSKTHAFTPLYQLPALGQNTLTLENEKGKRFELPEPITTVK
ncbi:hypothetical protein MOMA_01285 [Moraxella macacae 0408225]|uniref:Lipoprotein n=1 Tax=Moraxella macacae 0408225 TaxID=1230338 RepID=L2F7W1_9GAMM|nr:hypothetical protein [Moraxella macacae]ELA09000.1 hypothetical protein MOMA_01285 [Moraxella macacae 0408225]